MMRYATPTAFRQALDRHLAQIARAQGIPLVRVRKAVAFDRFLARLLAIAPDRWYLKGGFALECRLGVRARTTLDIDLGGGASEAEATADLLAAQQVDLGDFFSFEIVRTAALDGLDDGIATRFHARAMLAGRLFEEIRIDIGAGDAHADAVDAVPGPTHLAFAAIPPLIIPTIALPQHIAEKVHASTRPYAGGASSRTKDLVDLIIMQASAEIAAGPVRAALARTFAQRGTHPLPGAFPPPPPDWAIPYRRLAAEVRIITDLAAAHARAAAFLDPILDGRAPDRARWDAGRGVWLLTTGD